MYIDQGNNKSFQLIMLRNNAIHCTAAAQVSMTIPVHQGHESSLAVRLTSLCLIYLTENNRASTENQFFVILMYD